MRTTLRSRVLIASSVGLAFSAILFRDVTIGVVLLILIALLLGDYSFVLIVTRQPKRWFAISEGSPGKKILYPGDLLTSNHVLTKRVSADVTLSSELPFLEIQPNFVRKSDRSKEIHVDFKTPFSGDYEIQRLALCVLGPLKLVSGDCFIQFRCKYTVFPKVAEIATTSSRLLARIGIGQTSINRSGPGTEFHELRQYQVGDDYRQINWKASARMNELVVNERQREADASYYLVIDSRVDEYSDRDRLASSFLHIANTLTMLGVSFGVMIHDGEKIEAMKRLDAPETSLVFSLYAALDIGKVSKSELPEALTAVTSHAIRANRKMLIEGGYPLLSEIEDLGQVNLRKALNLGQPMHELITLSMDSQSNSPVILYFTALHGPVSQVIEVAAQITRNYSGRFTLVAPTMPWVTARNEDEACEAYLQFRAKLRAFEFSHIDYAVGEPSAIARRLFESPNDTYVPRMQPKEKVEVDSTERTEDSEERVNNIEDVEVPAWRWT